MLDITISTRNVDATDWIENHVQKKIGKMDRYLPILTEASVELSREPVADADRRYVAQATLRGGRTVIRAQERGGDVAEAVDAVEALLYRQIARYKGKRFDRSRATPIAGEMPPLPEEIMLELEEEEPEPIVRVKRFTLHPMVEDEAIDQMELLGHDFFLFYNANSGRINVVYRRRDGGYGLLDPEQG